MFVLINTGFDEGANKFDPEAEEEKYYADCDETFNDSEIVGCVAREPTYEEDVKKGWPDGGPMPHEKMELESVYFTGSNFTGNTFGFNPGTGIVYPEVVREMARRSTLNAPSNQSLAGLQVVVKRVSLLLNKDDNFTPLVLRTFGRTETHSCRQLYEALGDTRDNRTLAAAFKR